MEQVVSNYKPRKWYNKEIFPLIPTLEIRKANEYNTSGFVFKWLIFTVWSIDAPSFELAIVADTHWGIGVIGLFLYCRWVIAVPCPQKLGIWVDRNFSRSRHIGSNKY